MTVGDEFIDSAGCRRRSNRWGFNSFVTVEEGIRYARGFAKSGSRIRVWALPDGTFDCSLTDHPPIDCTAATVTPIAGAELIRVVS